MKTYYYIYSLRKLQNNQERTMISYAKYKTELYIPEYPYVSKLFWVIPEPTQSFFWHEKESSGEFRTFLHGCRTFHDELFLISKWLVNLSRKILWPLVNNLFIINIWVNRNHKQINIIHVTMHTTGTYQPVHAHLTLDFPWNLLEDSYFVKIIRCS